MKNLSVARQLTGEILANNSSSSDYIKLALNELAKPLEIPPVKLVEDDIHRVVRVGRGLSCGASAPVTASESAREPSGDQTAVSERGASQGPDPGNHQVSAWYPDIRANDFVHVDKFTPGYGEAHAVCGEVRFVVVCPDNPKHHKKIMRENCKRPACPKCWPGWAGRAADAAAQRIEGYREAHRSELLPRHISLHPPEVIEDLQVLLDKGREVFTVLGAHAAAVIPHHDRLKPNMKARCEAAAADHDQNRYEYALSQENWYDFVRTSPHLHLEVYGPLMDAEEFHEKTGWTYRNHDEGAGSGRSGAELKKTIYYLLTHAWVRGNHKVVRYWAGMNTHRLKCVDLGVEKQPCPCPVCRVDLVKTPPDVIWQDGSIHPFYQDLHNAPVHFNKVHMYRYEIRHKVRKRVKRISARSAAVWGPAGPPVPS